MAKIGIIVTLMVFIVILSLCAADTLLTTLIPLGKEIRYKMTDEDKKDLADNVEPSIILSLIDSSYRVSEFTYKIGLVREFIISLAVFMVFMSGAFLLTYAVVLTLTRNFVMS